MDSSPLVCIIILNWNNAKDTLACLNSLEDLEYDHFHVLVIDNGSTNNSVSLIKENYPWVEVIENKENLGFAAGNNLGIKWALMRNVNYLVLLNNDTIVAPDFVTKLVEEMEENDSIGISGPTIYYFANPDVIWSAGCYIDRKRGTTNHIGIDLYDKEFNNIIPRKVDFVTGCAICIRSSVIDSVGSLDERFFAYFEEAEFCYRATLAGFEVWHIPQARLWHKISKVSREDSPIVNYYMTRNRLLFLEAIGAGISAWIYTLIFEYLRTLLSWRFLPRWQGKKVQREMMMRAIYDYFSRQFGKYPSSSE